MKTSGLDFLGELCPRDVEWVLSTAKERRFAEGEKLIIEGSHPEAIFIVLEGLLGVKLQGEDTSTHDVATPGEILGELSFLDDQPASATVVALEDSSVLTLPRADLDEHLKADPSFGLDFYQAMGSVVSGRLRNLLRRKVQPLVPGKPIDDELWASISGPIHEYKALLRDADQRALKNEGVVTDEDLRQISQGLTQFSAMLTARIGDDSGLSETTRARLGATMQTELLLYVLLSDSAERWYSKPRGYAGDYLSIERYYENQSSGAGRLGPAIDRAFLDLPASQAVRNRLNLLIEQIGETVATTEGDVTKIASLACGPARELFDYYEKSEEPKTLQTTLIDMDLQALAFVADKRDRRGLRKRMRLVNENLIYLAAGRSQIDLEPQDLIYSVGLIDYLADKHVVALINFCHDTLRPGGRLILGNFHTSNPEKAMMDYLVDWRLIHRTEDDINRLYEQSRFGRPCTRIFWEDQHINLFGECVKE